MGNCYGTDFVEEYGQRDLQCPRDPILVGANLKFEEETTMMFQPKRLDWGGAPRRVQVVSFIGEAEPCRMQARFCVYRTVAAHRMYAHLTSCLC